MRTVISPIWTKERGREMSAEYKKYICVVCSHIYDEAEGDPPTGVAPGTRWADVPADWTCPECGVTKADFQEM